MSPRSAIELDVYRSNPTGGSAMFGLARLLDDLAFSLHVGDEVHHVVVSGAMDIARHMTRYLLPTVQADGHRGPVP